jgi:pyruvate dehydrogenase E2 component (dihydrolipoamide acetyltransferase)
MIRLSGQLDRTVADFMLPDLGEGLTDAEIIRWLVEVGDVVGIDQPVVEVETAKAAVEVPVPFAGTVSAVFGAPGERVLVGSPLITVDPVAVHAASNGASGNVLIGYGTSASPSRRKRRASRPPPSAGAVAAPEAAGGGAAPIGANHNPANQNHAINNHANQNQAAPTGVISPVVRRLAKELGVDLSSVRVSDPSGIIRRRDVENTPPTNLAPTTSVPITPSPTTSQLTPAGTPAQSASPTSEAPLQAGIERIPLAGLRRTIARKLSHSRQTIPEATVWVDVDATALLEARRALNTATPAQPVSVLALLSRFCVAGLRRYRELNSRITEDAIELLPDINLSFATQTDTGLMVPVIPRAHAMTTRELACALKTLTEGARAGTLTPAQMSGGTFTVNNYGIYGVDGSAAIINHPEVAIIGIGRIIDRPWVVDGQLAIRRVSQLTLAFDHRACDGAVAGGFLRFVADCVENPVMALGDL